DELVLGRGEFRKRIDESSCHQWGDILYDIHQDLLLEKQMHGAPDAWIVERLSFGIQPGGVNDALVKFCGRELRNCCRLAGGNRVERAAAITSALQDPRAQVRGTRQGVVNFDAIEVRQPLVP